MGSDTQLARTGRNVWGGFSGREYPFFSDGNVRNGEYAGGNVRGQNLGDFLVGNAYENNLCLLYATVTLKL